MKIIALSKNKFLKIVMDDQVNEYGLPLISLKFQAHLEKLTGTV